MILIERTLITTTRRRTGGVEVWMRYWREVERSSAAPDLDGFPEAMFPGLERRYMILERDPVIELLL